MISYVGQNRYIFYYWDCVRESVDMVVLKHFCLVKSRSKATAIHFCKIFSFEK